MATALDQINDDTAKSNASKLADDAAKLADDASAAARATLLATLVAKGSLVVLAPDGSGVVEYSASADGKSVNTKSIPLASQVVIDPTPTPTVAPGGTA